MRAIFVVMMTVLLLLCMSGVQATDSGHVNFNQGITVKNVLDPAPSLWLKTNDGSGTTVVDSSLYGNNGTIAGAGSMTWQVAQGKVTDCLEINTTVGSYIRVEDSATLSSESLSVCFWMKSSSGIEQNMYVEKSDEYKASFNSSGRPLLLLTDAATGGWKQWVASGTTNVYDGNWNHILFTYHVGDSLPLLYINGAQNSMVLDTSGGTFNTVSGTANYLKILSSQSSVFWIDDIRFYRGAIGSLAVKRIYNNGNGTETPHPNVSAADPVWLRDCTDAPFISTDSDGALKKKSSVTLTSEVSGILPLANGGTGANITASNGGIFYSTGSVGALLSGTATAGKILSSGASSAPSWSVPTFPVSSATAGKVIRSDGTNWIASTSTWPEVSGIGKIIRASAYNGVSTWSNSTSTFADTYAQNDILYAGTANTITGLTASASKILVTNGSSVPGWATDLPTAVTIGSGYIYRASGTDVAVADGGTGRSSWTQYLIPYASTTTALSQIAIGTSGQPLVSAGAGSAPAFSSSLSAITITNASAGTGASPGNPCSFIVPKTTNIDVNPTLGIYGSGVYTTNNTPTTILTAAIGTGYSVQLFGFVNAVNYDDPSVYASYTFSSAFGNPTGTAACQNLTLLYTSENAGHTGWNVTGTASGANGLVQVTGENSHNIKWNVIFFYTVVGTGSGT